MPANKKHQIDKAGFWKRRRFLGTLTSALGVAAISHIPGSSLANRATPFQQITVQQVMDLILKSIPGAPFKTTVDTLKSGKASQPVKGIVTTMFATCDVISKAAALGANFIIAHEPTFYNHLDDTSWLENDDVYKFKFDLLQKHKIAVWRFHDYIHAHRPDGVMTGVLQAMGWQKYSDADTPRVVTIPPASLQDIIDLVKSKLGIDHVKVVGDRSQQHTRILLMPGASGGKSQITALHKEKPDLLICGELNEWETSEYIRDLRSTGSKTALVVLGHIVSEEPGLEWLVHWLQPQVPAIKVTHIPTTDVFSWA